MHEQLKKYLASEAKKYSIDFSTSCWSILKIVTLLARFNFSSLSAWLRAYEQAPPENPVNMNFIIIYIHTHYLLTCNNSVSYFTDTSSVQSMDRKELIELLHRCAKNTFWAIPNYYSRACKASLKNTFWAIPNYYSRACKASLVALVLSTPRNHL